MNMSWLSDLFGGHKQNPMDEANKYINQIPGVGHKGYDPYINRGEDASTRTKSKYEELMNDPTAFMNKLMEGYKPSEGYQFQKGQLQKEMGNTAASGGVAGTPMDQMNQAEGIQGILGKDMQQYLSNAFGAFNTGLQGEQGVADTGFKATGALTDLLGSTLNKQGGMAFQNAQQNNSDKNGFMQMLIKALGTGAGALLGGPAGGAIGGGIGGLAGPMSGSPYHPWNNPG